jgi:glutamate N-acetyltransferase / amino-acid N-acetyltransferase
MAAKSVSPLAPASFPDMPAIGGVRFATAEAGIRYKNRRDVFLALMDEGTTASGVFTTSRCPSAAVDWCRKILPAGKARALVVNSGNANAFTGLRGAEAVGLTADIAGKAAGCAAGDIYIASTGVIGEPLDATKFEGVLQDCAKAAAPGPWQLAAEAIMTTDTFAKGASRTVPLGGVPVTINGIAKGAGMIAPDMATMLSFIFTDAPIAAAALQALLSHGVKSSFNCVTVDGDTSTSDTLLLFATGKAATRGAPHIADAKDPRLAAFRKALDAVLLDLAQQVARDGEGARKFATVRVEGASSSAAARKIAQSIANSPLVKTALAGEDANWGRVVMAVGKAGQKAERDKLSIWFGPHRVATSGMRDPAYSEAAVSEYMRGDSIEIRVDLGLGRGKANMYTCDFTKTYIEINGNYRS